MTFRRNVLCFVAAATALAGCSSEPPTADSSADVIENRGQFFRNDKVHYISITGWDNNYVPRPDRTTQLYDYKSTPGATLRIIENIGDSGSHCPDDGHEVYRTQEFKIRSSGNLTNCTPKSSFKIKLTGDSEFVKMDTLNLKSMWNDVSQMREALAWDLFDKADVPSSGHGYARLCVNGIYLGLYSTIEEVDKKMLKDSVGANDGNLYKGNYGDVGAATLEYLGTDGAKYRPMSLEAVAQAEEEAIDDWNDSGRASCPRPDGRTYDLKTNDDEAALNTYADLATFITVLNGRAPGAEDFNSDAYRKKIEEIFDVYGFLRWASVNLLLGAWDNYWGSPSNYYLYNQGQEGFTEDGQFVQKPYFKWIPWDYDNSFGIDYFGVPWARVGVLSWQEHTRDGEAVPLIENLLKNKKYLGYYLDHMECMLDNYVNTAWIDKQIGDGSRGLWRTISKSVRLEADGDRAAPHTGRQFTWDQVYWNGFKHQELNQGGFIPGIWHYVNERHDTAKGHIQALRQERGLSADPAVVASCQ